MSEYPSSEDHPSEATPDGNPPWGPARQDHRPTPRPPARRRRLAPALLLAPFLTALALPACGDLPQPFRGNPGGQARRLAAPPAYRLAVPPPQAALLTDAAAGSFAAALAGALEAAEVPAVAGQPNPLDWRLTVTAERDGRSVVPAYALADADGRTLASASGAAVPLAEWGAAGDAVLRRVAARDAPAVAALLARADAASRSADPATLVAGGPPRLRLVPVRGAPGDGNRALTARIADVLGAEGFAVQDRADGAAFALQGIVEAVNTTPGKQRIEIQWIVTRRDGEELGRAVQINEVTRGSLDRLWGDVAYVAAQEAGGGVRTIIANAGGFAAIPGPQEAPPPAPPRGT